MEELIKDTRPLVFTTTLAEAAEAEAVLTNRPEAALVVVKVTDRDRKLLKLRPVSLPLMVLARATEEAARLHVVTAVKGGMVVVLPVAPLRLAV